MLLRSLISFYYYYYLRILYNVIWSCFSTPPRSTPFYLPTQLCVFPTPTHVKFNLCYLYILGCGAFHWSMANLPETTPLKKTDSPSPRSHQLPVAPQLGVKLHARTPLHVVIWPGLSFYGTCICCHNYYEFICSPALLYPKDTVFSSTSPLLLAYTLLFQNDSWALGGEDMG